MLRLGASLERIPSAYKAEIGNWMMEQIAAMPAAGAKLDAKTRRRAYARYLWALGRVGARQSFHASAHEVAPREAAEGMAAASSCCWTGRRSSRRALPPPTSRA